MFIKNLEQMRHCYKCKKCSKILNCGKQCNRHENKCDALVKHVFKGGVYNPAKIVFDRILTYSKQSDLSCLDINENDLEYPFEICYDFEAMSIQTDYNNDKQSKIKMENVPISCSNFSNIPGYDKKPIFFK